MAEDQIVVTKEKIPTRKIKVKNIRKRGGSRLVFDHKQKQYLLAPGQEAEVEVTEPEAVRMEEASKAGADLEVEGSAAEAKADEKKPSPTRAEIAAMERDELEAGQEADKERRERDAKKSGEQLAAETGIQMHAHGTQPEVVTAPADAPPKKK